MGSRHPLTVARGRRYVEKVLWCTDCNGNQLGADCPFLFSLDLGEDDQGRPIPPNFGSLQECTSWVGTKFNELMWGALKHDWGEGSSISDCPFLDASGWGECPDIDKVPLSAQKDTAVSHRLRHVFPMPSWLTHRLCLVFPLPARLRHCLCPVFGPAERCGVHDHVQASV